MKKVLIIPSWYPSDPNPVLGVFVQQQASALLREYGVAVLVPKLVPWRDILKGNAGCKSETEERAGLKVYRERALAVIPRMQILAYKSYAQATRRGIEKLFAVWGTPDIIHAHVVLPAGWAAVEMSRRYAIPVVLTEHSGPFSMHLQTRCQRRLVHEALTRADRVVAVSPAIAREIHAFQNTAKISVVGNVIDTDFFTPLSDTREKQAGETTCFLSIAFLHADKGLNYLLEAAQILIQRGITSFELVIGGDGPDRPDLERLARAGGLSTRCRFPGMLTRLEVRQWMQRCDVFVLPSLHETFGVVLGEAMACGKPVLSTHCGGPDYVVTPDTGVLVDTASPTVLADAMEGFISGQLGFDSQAIRRSVVERFGQESFLANISAVYEEIWAQG